MDDCARAAAMSSARLLDYSQRGADVSDVAVARSNVRALQKRALLPQARQELERLRPSPEGTLEQGDCLALGPRTSGKKQETHCAPVKSHAMMAEICSRSAK
ncbi:hypothetical protein NDU88_001103 [Pleurodeles waltl]|uniref:Uncharacterized protein n=1 Tax=Pleurodeles waltl TaxID=8319 RepID=A0AAV7WLC9_PLEWA|nr:hypothetical protein NDU88_001103 [Pleurodeles waltl]